MNEFVPKALLKIYRNEDNHSYIEVHNVINGKEILPGAPLTKKALSNLIGIAEDNNNINSFSKSFVPQNLLSVEFKLYKRHILWYLKKGIYDLKFQGIKLKDGRYPMPALLFFVVHGDLKIFALRTGNTRPKLDTQLYHPPIFNTSGNGLCWGNVRKDNEQIEIDEEMDRWENLFWNSKFTIHGPGIIKSENLFSLYKSLYGGKKSFPVKELVKTKLTIHSLLKKYL